MNCDKSLESVESTTDWAPLRPTLPTATVTFTSRLSPGRNSRLFRSAVVHPHDCFTSVMRIGTSRSLVIENVWWIVSLSGTVPASNWTFLRVTFSDLWQPRASRSRQATIAWRRIMMWRIIVSRFVRGTYRDGSPARSDGAACSLRPVAAGSGTTNGRLGRALTDASPPG